MRLTPKKFYYIMTSLLVISIVGGGAAVYFANGLLKTRSAAVVDLKLQNRELEEQELAYRAAKSQVEKYSYLNDMISGALPQDKDQARTVREIFSIAASSGITIKSIQFPSSSLGTTVKPGAASGTTATTPSAAANAITQAVPVVGLNGVYSIATIVTPFADGKVYKLSYNQVIDFLSKLESNRRAMQVSDIQITPLGQNESDSVSFILTLNIFIKP